MKKEKFYYSDPLELGVKEVLCLRRNVIAESDCIKFVKNAPRLTICGIYDDEERTMSYGVSRCSHIDTFRKSVGRQISYNRALNHPVLVVRIPKECKISELYLTYAKQLEEQFMAATYPIKF